MTSTARPRAPDSRRQKRTTSYAALDAPLQRRGMLPKREPATFARAREEEVEPPQALQTSDAPASPPPSCSHRTCAGPSRGRRSGTFLGGMFRLPDDRLRVRARKARRRPHRERAALLRRRRAQHRVGRCRRSTRSRRRVAHSHVQPDVEAPAESSRRRAAAAAAAACKPTEPSAHQSSARRQAEGAEAGRGGASQAAHGRGGG